MQVLPLTAATLLMLSATGCAGSSTAFSPSAPTRTAELTRSFTPGHLYIADSGFFSASKVYRYPLNADGLPSKNPDGELTVSAENPGSIAIGPDGDLYISSAGTNRVDVFAPGASHDAKPVRILYMPQTPLYLAVDQQGYLDVSTAKPGNVTIVYAPNAQGHDKPINQISRAVNALGASNGIVYLQTLPPDMGIEGAPEHSSNPQPVYYKYGYNYSADGVVTEGPLLFAQFFWQQGWEYLLATAVFRIDSPGPPIRTIVGTGCRVSRNGGALGYGLAAYKKYLYEGCIGIGGDNGSTLIYDNTKNGREAPLMTLPGGNAGVAIGP